MSFDKCVCPDYHHTTCDIHFYCSRKFSCVSLQSVTPPLSWHQTTMDFLSLELVFPVLKLVWFLLVDICFRKLLILLIIMIIIYDDYNATVWSFYSVLSIPLWMYTYFQFGALVNKAFMNILELFFVDMCFLFSWITT